MSGFNYHLSYLQFLEIESKLKLSSILNIYADLDEIPDLSIIKCSPSVPKPPKPCHVGLTLLTVDK